MTQLKEQKKVHHQTVITSWEADHSTEDERWEIQTTFNFAGSLLAQVTGEEEDDQGNPRKCTYRIFRSVAGKYICHAHGVLKPLWEVPACAVRPWLVVVEPCPPEVSAGTICDTASAVTAFFGDSALSRKLFYQAGIVGND